LISWVVLHDFFHPLNLVHHPYHDLFLYLFHHHKDLNLFQFPDPHLVGLFRLALA
jgi:hypothetical protein